MSTGTAVHYNPRLPIFGTLQTCIEVFHCTRAASNCRNLYKRWWTTTATQDWKTSSNEATLPFLSCTTSTAECARLQFITNFETIWTYCKATSKKVPSSDGALLKTDTETFTMKIYRELQMKLASAVYEMALSQFSLVYSDLALSTWHYVNCLSLDTGHCAICI